MTVDSGPRTSRPHCVNGMPATVPMQNIVIGPEQSSNGFHLNSPHEQLCVISYSREEQRAYITSVPERRTMKTDRM
jgi:hypothetical protein